MGARRRPTVRAAGARAPSASTDTCARRAERSILDPMAPRAAVYAFLLGIAAAPPAACADSEPEEASDTAAEAAADADASAAQGAAEGERRSGAEGGVRALPAGELAVFARELERSLERDALLCPGYARPAKRALRALGAAATDTRRGHAAGASSAEAASSFADEAALAAETLAELEPGARGADRRHAELRAAVSDLADGFSALAERAAAGADRAREARERTENGLHNASVAADAVLRACE